MKQILVSFLLLLVTPALGQNVPRTTGGREDLDTLERELQLWRFEHDGQWERQIVARQEAKLRQRDFVNQANRFVETWNRVMGNYARNGAFNVKEARDLSKAFRALESTGWPK